MPEHTKHVLFAFSCGMAVALAAPATLRPLALPSGCGKAGLQQTAATAGLCARLLFALCGSSTTAHARPLGLAVLWRELLSRCRRRVCPPGERLDATA